MLREPRFPLRLEDAHGEQAKEQQPRARKEKY
jgi:hypothetical protein